MHECLRSAEDASSASMDGCGRSDNASRDERQFTGARRSTRRLRAAESTGPKVRTRRSRVLCLQDRRRGRHLPGLATAVRSVPTSAASSDSDYNTLLLIVVTGLSPLLGERLASAGIAYGSRFTWSRRRQGHHPKDSDTLEPPGQLRTRQSPASHMPQSFHV